MLAQSRSRQVKRPWRRLASRERSRKNRRSARSPCGTSCPAGPARPRSPRGPARADFQAGRPEARRSDARHGTDRHGAQRSRFRLLRRYRHARQRPGARQPPGRSLHPRSARGRGRGRHRQGLGDGGRQGAAAGVADDGPARFRAAARPAAGRGRGFRCRASRPGRTRQATTGWQGKRAIVRRAAARAGRADDRAVSRGQQGGHKPTRWPAAGRTARGGGPQGGAADKAAGRRTPVPRSRAGRPQGAGGPGKPREIVAAVWWSAAAKTAVARSRSGPAP